MAIEVCGMTPLLQVFDMPTSVRFYCGVLGFEVVSSDGKPKPDYDWVMLKREGIKVMLNTAYEKDHRPPQPDRVRISGHRDVTLYFGCPDIDAAYEHLRALSVDAKKPKVAWYGMKQLYFSDPDGYKLCFQWQAEKSSN